MPLDPRLAPLETLYRSFDYATRLPLDPVSFVHQAAPPDQELVALLASALAWGRVEAFRVKIAWLLEHLASRGGAQAFVRQFEPRQESPWLEPFCHRVTRGSHLLRLFGALRTILEQFGSLEACFASGFSPEHEDIGPALTIFVTRIHALGPAPDRAFRHLLPSPGEGSACKRLNLFLRWMVRPRDGLDLGRWTCIPSSHLIMPLDTHTLRLSRTLGLTQRKDASWKTAVEVTRALRQLDPDDPVRFDFALCHLGMSGLCPSVPRADLCRACVLSGVCQGQARPEQAEGALTGG